MYPVCESSPESMGFACAVTLPSCQSCCGSFLKSLVVDLYWQWCQKIGLHALLPNRIPETRTLSEIERKSFIALPGAQGIPVSKTVFPSPGDLLRSFVGVVQGWSCWYRWGCVQGVETAVAMLNSLFCSKFAWSQSYLPEPVEVQIPILLADLGSEIFYCSPPHPATSCKFL